MNEKQLVEAMWAAIVGDDIAATCHQATVTREDLRAALATAQADMRRVLEEIDGMIVKKAVYQGRLEGSIRNKIAHELSKRPLAGAASPERGEK